MRKAAGLPIGLAIGIALVSLTGAKNEKERPAPGDLLGSWQWISSRDVKTGTVDSVAKHQLAWVSYTKSHAFYLFMEKNRPSFDPATIGKLPPAEQMRARYNTVWNEKGQAQFGGWASSYSIKGDTLTYPREISESPNSVGQPYRETIVRVDRNTLVIRSLPDSTGAAREETWKRMD